MAFSAMLTGCADLSYVDRAQQYSAAGNCRAAFAEVTANERDPGNRALINGVIYVDCVHDNATAIKYFTLAARYGRPVGEYLIRLGAPMPAADLVGSNGVNCTTVPIGKMISTHCE